MTGIDKTTKAEDLQEIINDESLPVEERNKAAQLLAEWKPANKFDWNALFEKIHDDYETWVAEENRRFKICQVCYRKQTKDREACELCGESKFERAHTGTPNGERSRLIWAATTASDDELNERIAHDSVDVKFVGHCARILELRGVPRVRGFWERAGFTLYGSPVS